MTSQEIFAKDLLNWRKEQLSKGGSASQLDWLLDLAAGISWGDLQKIHIDPEFWISIEKPLDDLARLWDVHLRDHTPLQYLLGRCPWRDFELEVTEAALIPRQETELLVDFALKLVEDHHDSGHWVDLGTGSGAIAVALARSLPEWQGHAVDISIDALDLAETNLKKLTKDRKCLLHCGNWWDPLAPWWGKISLAVANPPYIPLGLIDELELTVREHEPHLALFGGSDGLDGCREVIYGGIKALSPGGFLCIEHHHDQSDVVLELLQRAGFLDFSFKNDFSGIRRFAIARRPT